MRNRKKVFLLLLCSVVLSLLDRSGFLSGMKSVTDGGVISIKRAVGAAARTVFHINGVISSYQALKTALVEQPKQYQITEELKHAVFMLQEENRELRAQLGAPNPSSYRFIPAQVLSVRESMEISTGSKDGVKEGMTVLEGASFVGKISATSPYRSNVTLLTDPSLSIPARSSRGVSGIVVGQSGESVAFDHVLQKDLLFLDDQVFTSGAGGFPPNILIGSIIHIANSDVSVYKQATLQPAVDEKAVQSVFVINES